MAKTHLCFQIVKLQAKLILKKNLTTNRETIFFLIKQYNRTTFTRSASYSTFNTTENLFSDPVSAKWNAAMSARTH